MYSETNDSYEPVIFKESITFHMTKVARSIPEKKNESYDLVLFSESNSGCVHMLENAFEGCIPR